MGFTTAQDAYTASKGAMISLTRSMAIVYAKNNIRANIIHPGPVNTPMQKEWDEETKNDILCALCGSAVNKIFNHNGKCLINMT